VQHGQGGRAPFLRIRGVAADDGHGFRHVRCVGGGGRPAALCEKRIAAARSFKVLPAWPRSRPAARKAATSRGAAGKAGTPFLSHQAHQARTAERQAARVLSAFAPLR
jgi:hypothetical protein